MLTPENIFSCSPILSLYKTLFLPPEMNFPLDVQTFLLLPQLHAAGVLVVVGCISDGVSQSDGDVSQKEIYFS